MKNLFIYAAVIAATMGSMTACSDFLDVKPVTNKQEPDFVSQEGITQLLTGMYARLNSTDANDGYFRSTLTNYVYGDVMGGDANKGSTFQDQPDFTSLETYTFTTDNAYFETKWAHRIITTSVGSVVLYSLDLDQAGESKLASILSVSAIVLYILAIFAVLIVMYVYLCVHFYRTMYSAQGYLTHTLPVKTLAPFHVKLITSFVWMFLSMALMTASIVALIASASHGTAWQDFTSAWEELFGQDVFSFRFIFQMVLSVICSCLTYLLWVFASASIGQLFSSNKVAASLVAGIILYFMQQIFSMILMFGTGMFQSGDNSVNFFAVTTTIDNTTTSTASILPSSLFVTSNIYSIIVIVILYLVCARIITKHLNLE